MNASSNTLELVKRVLAEHAGPRAPKPIPDESVVFGPNGLVNDSLAILDALASIETAVGISIPDEDLTEELFSSVRVLAEYVERNRSGQAEGSV